MARCLRCGRRYGRDHSCVRAASQGAFGDGDITAPAPPAPPPPPDLAGYAVDGVLGLGGEAAVFAGTRLADGARAAIKVVPADAAAQQQNLERERDILARIGPPAVPAVLDLARASDGALCLAMERLAMSSLADELEATDAPMDVDRFASVLRAVLAAIGAVHARGLVHCDLKPENVFLAPTPDGHVARLIDFGIARDVTARAGSLAGSAGDGVPAAVSAAVSGRGDGPPGDASGRAARANAIFGTAEYMAPEQCEPGPPLDARVDIYAAGVIAYEALTGRPPFFGQPELVRQAHISQRPVRPSDLAPVGPGVEKVVLRCLAKDPRDRFEDVDALLASLDEAIRLDEITPRQQRPRTTQSSLAEARRALPCGLLFFESEASSPEVQAIVESFAGTLAHAARGQFGVVFEQSATENPVRRAVRAAQALCDRGACERVLVDLAPVQVRERKGARRLRSPLFKQADRFPGTGCPPGVMLTADARTVVPGLAPQRAPGSDGWYLVGAAHDGDGDDDRVFVLDAHDWPLVGRDRELRALVAAATRAADTRTPAIATVIGDAGVGKTRLAAELAADLARGDAFSVIEVRALEPLGGVGQHCLADLVRRLLALPDEPPAGPPADRGREVISAAIADLSGGEPWYVFALAVGWLSPDAPELEHLAAAPGALRASTIRAVGFAARRLAAHRPLALILDDAHLADETTLDALELATLADAGAPLWVCALARPSFRRARPAWGDRAESSQELTLDALPAEVAGELCRALLDRLEVKDVNKDAIKQIVSQTGGTPMLLVERVRSLRRDGVVRPLRRGDGWYLAADELERNTDIPLIQWLVEREVAALPDELAAHASLVALLGDEVTPDEVSGVLEVLDNEGYARHFPLDAKAGLRRLCKLNVLDKDTYAFRHALMRTVLAGRLPAELRTAVHHAAHRYYREQPPDDRYRARRAYHAERSGLPGEAGALYLELAEAARTQHAYVEAERLYSRVIDLLSDPALPAADGPGRMRAHRGRGVMRYRIGRYGDAIADLRQAHALAAELGDRRREIEILLDEAMALDWLQEWGTEKERVDRAEALAEGIDDPALRAALLMSRGRLALRYARRDEACELLEACVRVAEPLGMACYETFIVALILLGMLHAEAGRGDVAEDVLTRAMEQAEAYGDQMHVAAICGNRLWVWFDKKDSARAMEDLNRTIQISRELGMNVYEWGAQMNLGEVLYWLGDVDGAWPHVLRAIEIEQRCFEEQARRPVAELLSARLDAFAGKVDRARLVLGQIQGQLDKARRAGRADAELVPSEEVLYSMVDLLTRESTEAEWDALVERARQYSVGAELIEVIEMRGKWAVRRGRLRDGAAAFCEALEVAETVPNLLEDRIRRALADAQR